MAVARRRARARVRVSRLALGRPLDRLARLAALLEDRRVRAHVLEPVDAREGGKKRGQTSASRIVSAPPATTAGTAPTSAAAAPDSNAPSSFEAPMNTPSTALTRPRSSFGVASATVVARMFIEIMSTNPLTASASAESQEPAREAEDDHAHAERADDEQQRAAGVAAERLAGEPMPAISAPTATALRSTPSPNGPVCRIDCAKSGSSATAPPKSTAKRSSVIAPRMTGVARMKRIPPRRLSSPGGSGRLAPRPGPRDPEEEQRRGDEQHDAGRVDRLGPDREEEPADCRPRDRRDLAADRPQRERAGQELAGDELRHERAAGRVPEGGHGAGGEREREERPELVRAVDRDDEEQGEDGGVGEAPDEDDREARQAVGELSRRQREQRHRRELGEPIRPRSKALWWIE